MDSRNPLPELSPSGKQESNAIPLYNRRNVQTPARFAEPIRVLSISLPFSRRRPGLLPAWKERQRDPRRPGDGVAPTPRPPAAYARLFEPGSGLGKAPSGLADWPAPSSCGPAVWTAALLPWVKPSASTSMSSTCARRCWRISARPSPLSEPRESVPGHGRASLERVEQLTLEGAADQLGVPPLVLHLDCEPPSGPVLPPSPVPHAEAVRRIRVRVSDAHRIEECPGGLVRRPEFSVLFGRLRDRLSTLRTLYGPGPLPIDFREAGERAAQISLTNCRLQWENVQRKSGRTGQTHPLGGFTGHAEYEGPLDEFVPWLRAARWVGVGRQTVWGKEMFGW